MWEVNSFDALHDLFDNLGALLSKSKEESEQEESQEQPQDQVFLSKTSPLGVFVRRARLEFMRLQFDDAMKLWTAFIVYRAPTAQWSKRMAGLASSGIDTNAVELGLQSGDELFEIAYGHLADEEDSEQVLSMDDYDRLLEFQLDQLQRMSRIDSSQGFVND
jgi:anaphase-promoting complex subunit 5